MDTVDTGKFCVSWQPGTFGNLIKNAINLQKNGAEYEIESNQDHSHYRQAHNILVVHPHSDLDVPNNISTIKPYFSMKQFVFFPKYLHYLKYFKSFPDSKTMQNYYNVEIGKNFFKEILKTYWNYRDGTSTICYNINMDDFFYNFDLFIKNFESFVGERLKQKTLNFLSIKRKNNLRHLENFTRDIIDSVDLLEQNKSKNITFLSDYEKLLIISTHVQNNWDLTSKFLRSYDNTQLTDVTQIYNFIYKSYTRQT